MSRKNPKKWIVKDAEGKIYGPFTSDQVLEQIDRNYFLGGELVAEYPGGSWVAISKSPEFYDRLLDVLAAEVKADSAASQPSPSTAMPSQEGEQPKPKTVVSRDDFVPKPKSQTVSLPEESTSKKTMTAAAPVIELTDVRELQEDDEEEPRSRLPLYVLATALVLGGFAYIFLSEQKPIGSGNKIHFIAPRKGQTPLPDDKLKEKFRRAIAAFQLDTFAGYQRAQNELVETVEGASQKPEDTLRRAEQLSFLCLTYRELWPFAFQDSRDLKVVSETMQEAKKLDPGGLHGALCEIVQLMLNGRTREAQGLSESVLLEKSQAPVLFEMRSDLFSIEKDFQNAAGYAAQARAIWPNWQKSAVSEARARIELKQFPQAIQLLRDVLVKVPEHGAAKIELGLLEALQFNQVDKGFNLIKDGVDQDVARITAARGHFGLAQIYLKRKQNSRALDAVKKAYALDPSHREAKTLLEQLGGNTKGSAATDTMFLGEQYLRAGDYFSAQAQFKAAYEANNKNAQAAMKAGKCLWKLNQTVEAIEWMKKARRADPKLIAATVELADYYAQRFDYYAAVQELKAAQQQQPNSYEVYRGFAIVELRRNNFQGAAGFGERALKLYETDLETFLIMARANQGLQKYQEALKFAAKAIDLDYNNTEAHALYGKIEAGLHGVDSGASYIQQLLNKYVITQGQQVPQAAIDLRIALGEIYLMDDRSKPAEEVFRQAVSLDPNARRALINLGKVLQKDGQKSLALEYFLKAAVLDPSDPEPVYYSGELYDADGKYAEATRQFERVLKINPRYPKAHAALGRTALKKGDAKRALEEAMQERAINPDLADAYLLAAEAYFNLRQFSNCAAEYQKAASKRGQGAIVLVRMSRCYRLSGAFDSAQSLLRQAIAQESGLPEIYKEQAAIFHMKALADEAIGAYDTYLRLAPNAPDRAEIENRIKKIQAGDLSIE